MTSKGAKELVANGFEPQRGLARMSLAAAPVLAGERQALRIDVESVAEKNCAPSICLVARYDEY